MEEITKIRVGDIIVAFYMEQPDAVHINMVNFADINAVISKFCSLLIDFGL